MIKDICKVTVLVLFAMAFLVCFSVSIVAFTNYNFLYPNLIVNVDYKGNETYTFYGRCDYFHTLEHQNETLTKCNVSKWIVKPNCEESDDHINRLYAFGEMKCPTKYLEKFKGKIDLSVHLIGIVGIALMFFSAVFILGGVFMWRYFYGGRRNEYSAVPSFNSYQQNYGGYGYGAEW